MIETKEKLNDYVVIDIENPNRYADSICQIGIIQVKNKEIVYQKSMLINPEANFDDINMRVNKITPNMVKNSITFNQYWEEIKDIITNNVIIGHGIKFDISVISKALNKYEIKLPKLKLICTQHLCQKYLDITKYRLDYVCDYLNIKLDNHHDAYNDAEASLKIFEYIKNNYDISNEDIDEYLYDGNSVKHREMKIAYTDDTKSLQELKSIIEKIMFDKEIDKIEVENLKTWLLLHHHLIGNYPFDKINEIVNNVLDDENITKEEYEQLNMVFNEFINPLSTTNENSNIVFENRLFCLTGSFNNGSKEDIENKIISKGGICSKSLTSKVNYLIVGGAGSDAWKFGNYGGKVQKAMELNEKGKNIVIIGEDEFMKEITK